MKKRWSFAQKLFLVNLVYLLPCAVLVFFLVKEKNSQLEFSQKELYGIEYQRPLMNLLLHLSQHKSYSRALMKGETAFKERLANVRNQLDSDFSNLEDVDLRLGETLLMSDVELNARKRMNSNSKMLRANWQSLVDKYDQSAAAEIMDRHDRLIADVNSAISHIADSSNLILDPDLDSYYIMDVTALALPQSILDLERTLNFLQSTRWDAETLTRDQIVALANLIQQLKNDQSRLATSILTAINEDKKFHGNLPVLQRDISLQLKEFSLSFDKFTQQLQSVLDQKYEGAPLHWDGPLMSSAWGALDQSTVFWNHAADVLEKLIEARRKEHFAERIMALVLALLAWLPPALLALFTVHRLSTAFKQSVAKLEREAEGANASSVQLASASSLVSSGSTEQAAAIQETGASMSEIASMIARSSTQAVSSQELAQLVTQRADEGCAVMERLVMSMESIHEANAQLQNISHIIHEISNKTNVINEIVGKTQLLSFNASIEAARAGQHGRGFAVVAEEVGNLAQTSGNAAKSIRDLIEDSQKQVAHILKTTVDRVAEGKVVTEQAQKIFSEIARDISTISTQMESVTEAAHEQQLGVEQISKAMMQMDQTTHSNNKAAHLAAQLSDHLAGQSRKLTIIARSLADLVQGGQAGSGRKLDRNHQSETRDSGHPEAVRIVRANDTEQGDQGLIESLTRKNQAQDAVRTGQPHAVTADDDSFKEAV